MRPTLADIARETGVSAATVDRVLHGRAGVTERTRQQVLSGARRIGYLSDGAETPQRPVLLHVLLPEGTNAFIRDLARLVAQRADTMPGVTARIETIPSLDPAALAVRLARLRGAQGVALVGIDHPLVRDGLRALVEGGTPVVTLVSDIPAVPRLAYVGIDNGQAGRLAGYVTGRFLHRAAGKVAFFAGSLSYRGHQEREMGFRQILTEEFAHLSIVHRGEVREDRDLAHAETLSLLDRHPDLCAIYNAGGATAGIARALTDRGRQHDTVFVAHEATAGNKALLLDGTLDAVIDQNPGLAIREALATLAAAARGSSRPVIAPRVQIVFRENLPVD